ncbi:hypothetical protein [Lysinibacillus boronitolerans]|uniref:hypothetical protein n=1 Tax=Lysinibacillus boronitolerans TaxID=309788 RepID=UPI001EE64899|nr:hypothetical protein [Lysinibacillus boronitolerans]
MEQRVERLENDRCKTCLAVAKSNIKEIREALGRIKVTKITKKSHSPPKTHEIKRKACLCTFTENLAIIRFANT